jgi:pimeloyl-ACP methyl ester carboxylesterase
LPGNSGVVASVIAANARGWNVVFPQFPGTYDSDGVFEVSSAASALRDLIPEVPRYTGFELPLRIVAHSFGGFVLTSLLRLAPGLPIEKVLLLAPAVSFQADVGFRVDFSAYLEAALAERPYTYRVGSRDEWDEICRGGQPVPKENDWPGVARIVIGDRDHLLEPNRSRERLAEVFATLTGCPDVALELVPGAGHRMHELLAGSRYVDEILGEVPRR